MTILILIAVAFFAGRHLGRRPVRVRRRKPVVFGTDHALTVLRDLRADRHKRRQVIDVVGVEVGS